MAATNMFIDPTAQTYDWRIVEISQSLISHEVELATSLSDLFDSKLLTMWIKILKKSSEARRCVHYIFK